METNIGAPNGNIWYIVVPWEYKPKRENGRIMLEYDGENYRLAEQIEWVENEPYLMIPTSDNPDETMYIRLPGNIVLPGSPE